MKNFLKILGRMLLGWSIGMVIYFTVIGVFGLTVAIGALVTSILLQAAIWRWSRRPPAGQLGDAEAK